MRASRTRRTIIAAAVAMAASSAPAGAVVHTVNFDTFPDNSAVAAGTAISSQYPGVTFPDSPPPAARTYNNSTQSPPNALRSSLPCTTQTATSCPAHRLPMNFSPAVSAVTLYAGDVVPSELGGTWGRLVGYSGPNGTGTIVAQSHNTNPNGPDFELGGPVTTRFDMTSFSGATDIQSAVLYVGKDTGQGDQTQPEPAVIDSLSFEDGTSPPQPVPAAPTVSLTAPANGSTLQSPDLAAASGQASAPAGVDRFCIVVDQSSAFPSDCQNLAFTIGSDGRFSNVTVSGLTSGAHTITAWLRDSRGRETSASVSVTIATAASGVNLRINGVEVIQAAQTLSFPVGPLTTSTEPGLGTHVAGPYAGANLVADAVTAVRVYANASSLGSLTGPARRISALLYGFREGSGGGLVPLGAPIAPLNGTRDLTTGPATIGTSERLGPAYTFVLPADWASGTLRLVAVLNTNLGFGVAEANRADNVFGVTRIGFTPTRPVFLTPIEFTHTAYTATDGTAVAAEPTGPVPADAFDAARATTPLGAGQLHVLGYAARGLDVTAILRCNADDMSHRRCSGDAYNDMLDRINTWRNSTDHYGKVFALGYGIGGVTDGSGNYALADIGHVAGRQRPLSSVNHELGHMFGLAHSSYQCGGGTGGQSSDPSYPDPQYGRLLGFAFDRRTMQMFGGNGTSADPLTPASVSTDSTGTVVEANGRIPYTDLMTYCFVFQGDGATWLSPFNWNKILNGLKVRGTLHGFNDCCRHRAAPRAAGTGLLRVSADVLTNGDANILTVAAPEGATATAPQPGSPFHLVLHGQGGGVLADVPVPPRAVHSDDPPSVSTYIDAIVAAAGATSVDLVENGKVIASRARSAAAPKLRLLAPKHGQRIRAGGSTTIRWSASDADGDPLLASVLYSPDAGATWHALDVGVSGTRASIRNALLGRSGRGLIRVVVNDGFNDTAASATGLRVAGRPPAVEIDQPDAGARLGSTTPAIFAGSAMDDGMHPIPAAKLAWYDGRRLLGRGAVITVRGLRAGTRRITLRARDRFGRTGTGSVRVKVAAVKPAFVKLAAAGPVRTTARTLRLTVAADVTARLRIGKQRFSVGPKTRTVTVKIAPGAGALTLRMKLTAFGATQAAVLTVPRAAR